MKFWLFVLLGCYICLCFGNKAYGQDTCLIRNVDFDELHEVYFADSTWFFRSGKLTDAKQLLNTTGWDTLRRTDFGNIDKPRRWSGLGIFALWVRVDTGLAGKKLSLRINHDGASELFIDGKPIGGYGKVGQSAQETQNMRAPRDIIPIWFHDTRPHIICIYYSNFKAAYPNFLGFQLSIGDYEKLSQRVNNSNRLFNYIPLCGAAQVILALLHFFLFLFYPRQKLNLYYALFVMFIGINCAAIYFFYQTHIPFIQHVAELATDECKVLIMWSGVLMLYHLNYTRVPRWRIVALTILGLFYIVVYFLKFLFFPTQSWNDYFPLVFLVCIADGCWSVWQVIKRGEKFVWLVATGVVAVTLLFFFAWDDTFHLWPYRLNAMRVFVLSAGELILPVCLSLYLALDFARTNQNLELKLSEVEKLSAQALAQEAEKRELLAGEARRLEEIVQQRTAELSEQADKLRELDVVKSNFFTNLTHEFKTPLTLILNPAKELISKTNDPESRQHLGFILNNATRLFQLINQMLDLSKVESGLMEVQLVPLNLVALIKIHVISYESLAKQKGTELLFQSDWEQLWLLGDRDKLDKIVLNVLSNALKFTDTGKIEISLRENTKEHASCFNFTIRDTGRGIPAGKLRYIFERFYQADPSDTRSAEGTGIGLALTKELVELMGGQITAESVAGEFTAISINLPYQPATAGAVTLLSEETDDILVNVQDIDTISIDDNEKPLVLLIEDHDELRDFMRQTLAFDYRVITAGDGSEGVSLALEQVPNLIITNLMMPGMDGYQVCTALKHDERSSHVPIIMLTAKADVDSRVQGIETGADAYLSKPFEKRELFAVIENLIITRNRLREYYSNRDFWFTDTISMPSIERDFILKVRDLVQQHLNEEGYSADQLANDIGLSRTQLHRKLKALIGQAPGELIRVIRLQYAHDLLERQAATIAEVGYMVGFNSPASFSASFSRHFGFPPKKVIVKL